MAESKEGFWIDEIYCKEFISKGSFGEVFLSTIRGHHEEQKFATKRISLDKFQSSGKKYLYDEVLILKKLSEDLFNDYIAKIVWDLTKVKKNYVYIVSEYCNGGNLSTFLKNHNSENKKPVEEKTCHILMKQLIDAFAYLHKKNIIHRDIKTDNIMFHFKDQGDLIKGNWEKGNLKIIDLGLAKYYQPQEEERSIVGTMLYMDPLMVNAREENNPKYREEFKKNVDYLKADIWSLGIVFYEMLMGKHPFEDGEDHEKFVEKLNEGKYIINKDLKEETVDLLFWMLRKDPKERFDIFEIKRHKFYKAANFNQLHKRTKVKNINKTSKGDLFFYIQENDRNWSKDKNQFLEEEIEPVKREDIPNEIETEQFKREFKKKLNEPIEAIEDRKGRKIDDKVFLEKLRYEFDLINQNEFDIIEKIYVDKPKIILNRIEDVFNKF